MAAAKAGRSALTSGLSGALLLALLLAVPAAVGGSPRASELACPRSETVWLRGTAAPGTALLARFDGVAVGGTSARADGAWAIPISVGERPGVYPVVVEGRQDGAVLAAFTCFVDLPVGALPTATATARPSSTAASVPSTHPATPTEPSSPPSAPTLDQLAPSATVAPNDAPSPTATAPVAPDTTTRPEPPTATPSVTPDQLALVAAQPDDPEQPGLFEYLVVENSATEARALDGWRLVHRETGESYAFPLLILPAGDVLVVWSGDGQDDPAGTTLFWPSTQSRWAPGQSAELVDPGGRVISWLLVPSPATGTTNPSPARAFRSYATSGGSQ